MSFLLVERILELIEGKFIRGTKQIRENDPFLYRSLEGRAYFAPALIGETLGQLAAWNVMHSLDFKQRPVAGIVTETCLKRSVHVGETLHLEAFIDNLDEQAVTYHGVASVNDEIVFTLDAALGPLLPMDDFIETEVVRGQFAGLSSSGHTSVKDCHLRVNEDFYFDSILSHEPGQSIRATKYIDPSAPFFADHFPKKPVWPLTVLLECVINLAQKFLNKKGGIIILRKIKMKEFVRPGSQVISTLLVKSIANNTTTLQSHTELDGKRVCVFELVYENKS